MLSNNVLWVQSNAVCGQDGGRRAPPEWSVHKKMFNERGTSRHGAISHKDKQALYNYAWAQNEVMFNLNIL